MKTVQTDVLIVGSGGAGLRAAIELNDNKIKVFVVGKCKKRDAHTILATGGINAALGTMDQKDSWEQHAADTLRDGGEINNPVAVSILCKNAPKAITDLVKWGVNFHRQKNGKLAQRFFGAATYRRACFVGDVTGREILNRLTDQVVKRKIPFKSEVYIFSLLHKDGKVNGALGLNIKTGKLIIFHAKIVVLATGGHSRMFKRSSSRFWENNGDGIKLAYDCGATCMDMEMFQFHPTGMMAPKQAEGVLVTEAVRGEGGKLTNARGERFMKNYDPKRMELSARDIVARAIYMEVKAGRGTKRGGVWLDITHRKKSYIKKRLPRMYKQFHDFLGLDISKKKMEVAPTAHYSMGGLLVDHKTGKTTVQRLYAIGEVTSGVHGGNRLGGNSLAEICVFGKLTGQRISQDVKKINFIDINNNIVQKKKEKLMSILHRTKGMNPIKEKEALQNIMWTYVGVSRNATDLKKAIKRVEQCKKKTLKVGGSLKMNEKLIAALDIQNMIPTCEMIIKSALLRKESRAAHYRTDFTATKKSWRKNILCVPEKKGFNLKTRGIASTPANIKKFLKRAAPDTKGHHMQE
jgi:succinate dehydrogenase / fumarate reductase, flavoprotein subunit